MSIKSVGMAHFRKRHAQPLLDQLLQYSPLVGVFGHRQCGKTTFVSHSQKHYVSLDDEDSLREAMESAKAFVLAHGGRRAVIDECQLAPPLFPALKEWVRDHPKPGQFILTGSVRFSSRKAIRESLTGRLVSLELYPMVLSELLERELPDSLPLLLQATHFDHSCSTTLKKPSRHEQVAWEKYLIQGGLPRLAFTRDDRNRQDLLESLLRLIVDRDLRMVVETRLSPETLFKLLRYIAAQAWEPYKYADARRVTGLSEVTQKKLLYGLESIFLVRRISIEGQTGDTFLLEDQLEENTLTRGAQTSERKITGALYRNLRAQLGYRSGKSFECFSYRLRSGAWVPLVFRSGGRELGLIVYAGDEPTLGQRRSASRFLRDFPHGKIVFVSAHAKGAEVLEDRVLSCAAASLVI